MDQRNLIVAIALSVIILLGSQLAMEEFFPAPPQSTTSDAVGAAQQGQRTAEGVPVAPLPFLPARKTN